MAVSKKYAGLPDLDPAPEIYETPELTDDASTVQTGTIRTESPTPSDDGDERLDRQRIDRESARRRFEPALVDAREANFSDTIASGERRSYKTRSRRRRRRKEPYEESDGSSDEETLSKKIARLKREAEEVKLELSRKEEEEEKFEDSLQTQHKPSDNEYDSVEQLSSMISHFPTSSTRPANGGADASFLNSLTNGPQQRSRQPVGIEKHSGEREAKADSHPSTASAVAAFADRLTALEAALGLSSVDPHSEKVSILPTLNKLSTQINTLSSTLGPTKSATTISSSTLSSSALPNLDALSARVRTLTAESENLTQSRKTALQSITELHEARLRNSSSRHHHSSRPGSSHQATPAQIEEAKLHSSLFLDEQASKISALYQVLPTIQNLQPLLPVVLERLRSLSVIHAGAAEAKAELDEVQQQQGEMGEEVKKWREAIESVEEGMRKLGGSMKGNIDVVEGMVRSVEERLGSLQTGRR